MKGDDWARLCVSIISTAISTIPIAGPAASLTIDICNDNGAFDDFYNSCNKRIK